MAYKFGLVFHNKKLAYSAGGKFRWMPDRCQHWIVGIWNFIACRLFSHDWHPGALDPDYKPGEWFCADCCKVEQREG